MRIRIWPLCLLVLIGIRPPAAGAQSLRVRIDVSQLRLTAPDLHFITGEALRQLHNGASVNYGFVARILPQKSGAPLTESAYRFAISYDLWEEKYAVTRLEPSPRSVSHLSSSAAETWCLESITLAIDKLGADQPFWVAVEYQIVEAQQQLDASDDARFTLTGLIDVLSRRSSKKELSGKKEGGPFRLSDLRRSNPVRNPENR